MPITEAILETARTHPDRPAIVGEDARLSYAGLVADSRASPPPSMPSTALSRTRRARPRRLRASRSPR